MTEAIYLLGREGGYPAQAELLKFWSAGSVRLWNPAETEVALLERRIVELMAKCRDTPCDFADATLVAAPEILDVRFRPNPGSTSRERRLPKHRPKGELIMRKGTKND